MPRLVDIKVAGDANRDAMLRHVRGESGLEIE